jgi:myo-inositol-1(or 4)-monophosphatase
MGAEAPRRVRVSETGGSPPPAGSAGGADAAGEELLNELLEVAIEAARMAGALLLERVHHGAERQVSSKSTPTDLVSEADLASERAIRELLAAARPQDGFVGEEGERERGASGLSWVVDPLDGTVNFLFSIPQWCVSVAVRNEQRTLAGAVYDPNRDELFTATVDGGSTMLASVGSINLDCAAQHAPGSAGRDRAGVGISGTHEALASAMVATGLAYDADVRGAQAMVLARLAPRVRDIRRFGSAALDLSWTAAGRYDAYFERSVKEWDIAAGTLICERAGLRVLELPVHESLPWGILVARPALAEQLFELVSGP